MKVMDKHPGITRTIRDRITSEQYKPGDKLPTVREFKREFEVSSGTIIKAIKPLVSEGLVSIRIPLGTYVTSNKESPEQSLREYMIWTYDCALPPRDQLKRTYGLSDYSLNKIFIKLKEDGLIIRTHGQGGAMNYIGTYGKERYFSMLFRQRYPNGIAKGQLFYEDEAFYRRLLRNGMLERLVPGDNRKRI